MIGRRRSLRGPDVPSFVAMPCRGLTNQEVFNARTWHFLGGYPCPTSFRSEHNDAFEIDSARTDRYPIQMLHFCLENHAELNELQLRGPSSSQDRRVRVDSKHGKHEDAAYESLDAFKRVLQWRYVALRIHSLMASFCCRVSFACGGRA